MNKLVLFFLALGNAVASDPATAVTPLPNGNILQAAGSVSAWEVIYESSEPLPNETSKHQVANASTQTSSQTLKPKLMIVARSNEYIREQTRWTDDSETESYIYRRLLRLSMLGENGEVVSIMPARYSPDFVNHEDGSFPGFLWVDRAHYVGIQKVDGRDCHVFQTKSSSLPSNRQPILGEADLPSAQLPSTEPVTPVTAAIDAQTLLPVFLDDGKTKRKYRILPDSQEPLVVPQAVETEMKRWVDKITESARKPAAP